MGTDRDEWAERTGGSWDLHPAHQLWVTCPQGSGMAGSEATDRYPYRVFHGDCPIAAFESSSRAEQFVAWCEAE